MHTLSVLPLSRQSALVVAAEGIAAIALRAFISSFCSPSFEALVAASVSQVAAASAEHKLVADSISNWARAKALSIVSSLLSPFFSMDSARVLHSENILPASWQSNTYSPAIFALAV